MKEMKIAVIGIKGLLFFGITNLTLAMPVDEHGFIKDANKELNAVYQEALSEFKDSPEIIKDLREAQKAWIVFRDKNCEVVQNVPLQRPYCKSGMISQRTKELRTLISEYKENKKHSN
ncbi:MAG: lysozyme inhibitor LprI family protein [Xenococcaceae cyanobacterium]